MVIDKILTSPSIYFQLLRFLIVLTAGIVFTRAVLMPLVRKAVSRRSGKKASHSLENITGLVGIFSTLILALQVASFGGLVTVIGTIAAAATVAVGFGMRDQVSSVIAGFFIYTDNPFLKGDYIKVNETEGTVREINLRTTVLNGSTAEKQVVPNNILTGNNVKNYTRGSRTKGTVIVKQKAEDAEKIAEIMVRHAENIEDVLESPSPKIKFTGWEEDKAEVELDFWVKDSSDVKQTRNRIYRKSVQEAVEKEIYREEENSEE